MVANRFFTVSYHLAAAYPPGVPGQQQQVQWMQAPQAIAGCPPGLEYLTQVDQLLVHQQVELLESEWMNVYFTYM